MRGWALPFAQVHLRGRDSRTPTSLPTASRWCTCSCHIIIRACPSPTVQTNILTPVWNELWKVKSVPVTGDLHVEVFDKDVGAPRDDYIGKFKTSVSAGAKEAEIEGPLFRKDRGTFWLKVR